MITTVTGKNQVTVPSEIAQKAHIHRGTRLEWSPTDRDDVLQVRVLPDRATLASRLRGRGKQKARLGAGAVERLIQERDREADRD